MAADASAVQGSIFLWLNDLEGVIAPKAGPWKVWARVTWSSSLCAEGDSKPDWWKHHTEATTEWSTAKVVAEVTENEGEGGDTTDRQYILKASLGHGPSRGKLYPLETSTLSLLANTMVKVEVMGQCGEEGAEEVLGVVEGKNAIPLRRLVVGSPGLDERLPLGTTGQVHLRMHLDDDTAEYCIGSTLLSIKGAIFSPLPTSWSLSPASSFSAAATAAAAAGGETVDAANEAALIELAKGPLGAKQSYTFSLVSSTNEIEEKVAQEMQSILSTLMLGGGKIAYEGEGKWAISWGPEEQEAAGEGELQVREDEIQQLVWLPGRLHIALVNAASSSNPEGLLSAHIEWKGSLPSTPSPDTTTSAAPPTKGKKDTKAAAKAAVVEEKEMHLEVIVPISFAPFTIPGTTEAVLYGQVGEEAEGGAAFITLSLARPLIEEIPHVSPTLFSLDVLPLRDQVPKKPERDVDAEFQLEVSVTIRKLSEEYVRNFVVPKEGRAMNTIGGPIPAATTMAMTASAAAQWEEKRKHYFYLVDSTGVYPSAAAQLEEKRKQYFYLLNSSGVYHDLKEKLKPRIQRLVRKRFPRAPMDGRERDEFVATLYAQLLEKVNVVLNKRIKDTKNAADDSAFDPIFPATQPKSVERIAELSMLAADAEAGGQWETSTQHHEDRVSIAKSLCDVAEGHLGQKILFEAYRSFAQFLLRVPLYLKAPRLRAQECFKQALSLHREDTATLQEYAALLLEEGQYEGAKAILQALNQHSNNSSSKKNHQPSSSAQPAITFTLLLLHADALGNFADTRFFLQKAVGTFDTHDHLEGLGVPRRTAVVILLDVADWLQNHNLINLVQRALKIADQCEDVALEKARERKLPIHTPLNLRVKRHRIAAQVLMAGNQLEEALAEAKRATEMDPVDGWSWEVLGRIYTRLGRQEEEAMKAYAKALDAMTRMGLTVPLPVLIRLGELYVILGDLERAKEVMLRCCAEFTTPTGWLMVGSICLKLSEFEDAEDALQVGGEGRMHEAQSALKQAGGEGRLHEAQSAPEQAMKCGLSNPSLMRRLGSSYLAIDHLSTAEDLFRSLLRRLGSSYIAIDHLSTAEDLLRRSLAAEASSSSSTSTSPVAGSSYTRRLLADVLKSQNALSQAAVEYRAYLSSPELDAKEREEAMIQYEHILHLLGQEKADYAVVDSPSYGSNVYVSGSSAASSPMQQHYAY